MFDLLLVSLTWPRANRTGKTAKVGSSGGRYDDLRVLSTPQKHYTMLAKRLVDSFRF